MAKKRVLILISNYPQLSQTYKENEIKYLYPDFEVEIASYLLADTTYESHFPFRKVTSPKAIKNLVQEFQPDIIHGHYLDTIKVLNYASNAGGGVPYTVRTHSFDVIDKPVEYLSSWAKFINMENCLGILAFPFLRKVLEQAGVLSSKIVDDYPVVDFGRFYDRSPNGDEILNTGACIPKKNMESYVDIAAELPERKFVLYPIGYKRDHILAYNEKRGAPVEIRDTVEPYKMPGVYKRAEWLIYSANPEVPTVGWPMAIAEAQASGCGVLVNRVRADLEEYVGGGGYLFEDIDEAKRLLRQPYPEELREIGFEQARKSDIRINIRKLHKMWGLS